MKRRSAMDATTGHIEIPANELPWRLLQLVAAFVSRPTPTRKIRRSSPRKKGR